MSEISAWMYLLDYMQKVQEQQMEFTKTGNRLPQRGQRKKGGGKKKPGKK